MLPPSTSRSRSKTLATWIAIAAGIFGGHRFYLHGARDLLAWLHPWPTLAGIAGLVRMRTLGQDDQLAWMLAPLFGLMLAQAMLAAIVYGLTPDERWHARHNQGRPGADSGWAAVLGVVTALLIGATALMSAIAFAMHRFFEWQLESGG
jgi:hypothetical protein